MHPLDDTIVAIASPPGGAARGIVRLSGPEVKACIEESFRAGDADRPVEATAPVAVAGSLYLDEVSAPLPCELYVWPAGRSYTGQPVAEIHTMGSPPLLEAVVRRFGRAGARLAQPGEFTLRAFLAGRIDLTQAEAVLGVVDAADPRRLDVALTQLAGGLAGPLHRLRDTLLDLLAHLEAGFDFADEDLPFIESEELSAGLAEASREVRRIVRQMAGRTETGRHIRAVLTGSPNTGKSSLFNALSGSAGALVSSHPGTTRDYLTAELDLDGVGCQLIDTAGVDLGTDLDEPTLDEALGSVDDTARAVASRQTRQAHLRIFCLDSTRRMKPSEREELAGPVAGQRVVVLTKVDLPRRTDLQEQAIATSSLTGQGINELRDALRDAVLAAGAEGADVVTGTAVRCRESLRLAADALRQAEAIVRAGDGEELVAAEIRVALTELGRVVGAVYTDDLLDRIFTRFCIGK